MTVLDQPVDMEPAKEKKFSVDLILVGFLLVSTALRDITGILEFDHLVVSVGLATWLCYLVGYWWINKPVVRSARNVIFTILYGIVLFVLSAALLFNLGYYSGAQEMMLLSLGLTIAVVSLDLLLLVFTKTRTINKRTSMRLLILTLIVILVGSLSQRRRVHLTYKNYPEFLKFYDAHSSDLPFQTIKSEYLRGHNF